MLYSQYFVGWFDVENKLDFIGSDGRWDLTYDQEINEELISTDVIIAWAGIEMGVI